MYEEYYGLDAKPFQLSPDARFFFNSAAHNRAMAYLRYGLKQGEGFIVITGGIGTGKTMLVRNLFAELDQEDVVAAQLVSTQINAEDVLRMVSAAFGLVHEQLSKAALLRNLEAFFRARRSEGKRVLLVIDEAQNLSRRALEELRMLSNYQDGGQALLQSFLLGQVELKRKLQGPGMEQVRQRIIAGYHLRPLDREEVAPYLEHRLTLVNWQGNPAFSAEAVNKIFDATGGIPRRINTVADRLLLFGCLEELQQFEGPHVDTIAAEVAQETGDALVEDDGTVGPVTAELGMSTDLAERLESLESKIDKLLELRRMDLKLMQQSMLEQLEKLGESSTETHLEG